MDEYDLIPNRLNFDAIVFHSCTMKEIQAVVFISLISSIALFGTLFEWWFGLFLAGMGLAFPATVALTWLITRFIQKLKQGKPKGWVKQKRALLLEDWGVKSSPYIRYSGYWTVGGRLK